MVNHKIRADEIPKIQMSRTTIWLPFTVTIAEGAKIVQELSRSGGQTGIENKMPDSFA
jgi:hypothetical protein